MACEGCEKRIQNALSKVDGVKEVVADHVAGKVNLTLDDATDERSLKDIISNIGFEVKK
jgi:copper chaperone